MLMCTPLRVAHVHTFAHTFARCTGTVAAALRDELAAGVAGATLGLALPFLPHAAKLVEDMCLKLEDEITTTTTMLYDLFLDCFIANSRHISAVWGRTDPAHARLNSK